MKRHELSSTESVAELFKVTSARTQRRLVRIQDDVDWELLTQTLEAICAWEEKGWPADPLDGLVVAMLAETRPESEATIAMAQLKEKAGDWTGLLTHSSLSAESTDLTDRELGHLRTVLRLLERRFGGLILAPLADMKDDRAVRELTGIPGINASVACTVLMRSFGRPVIPPTPAIRRVLTRMGVLPVGATESEAFKLLTRVSSGVSTTTLFHGLTAFASHTCVAGTPDCAGCPIWKLCAQGRQATTAPVVEETPIFVDLFAGAGGMSSGLTQAGFAPALAVEVEPWACETYRANHPELAHHRVLCGDIEKIDPGDGKRLLGGRRPDILAGGPPCQGFSLIGKRGRSKTQFIDDPRNRLYKAFIRWVAALCPRFVVMENVQGLYSYEDGAIRRDIESNLQELGYAVGDLIVDAARFGVPQRRQRVLFIGVATDELGAEAATQVSRRVVELLQDRCDPEVTLEEALGDLPPLEAGEGREAVASSTTREPSAYARRMKAGTGKVLFHHVARPVNIRDLLLYGRLKPGEKAEDAIEQGARHLMVYQNESYHDKYRRLRYDEPAPTIMSHLAKDGHMFIHPDPRQRRSISVREAARVQSFPDDFIFLGPRTHQFTQVGNAVPPLLARAVGEAIKQALSEVRE